MMVVKQKCVETAFVVYGKFVYDKGLTQKENITIETLAGIKQLTLYPEKGRVKRVKVDMGEPILEAEKIPVVADKTPVTDLELSVLDKNFSFTCVSMGNPHAITFLKDVVYFPVKKYGEIIEVDKHFPKRINVEFAEIVDENTMKMRVWERGTGETMACGTGACATVVAGVLNQYTQRKVNIELLGGNLEIEWNEKDNHIYMTGPATTVFEGELLEE